jgi:alcohol dehydrogenase class IV
MPDVAVLDAELTLGLPRGVTAATGMDALAHACEAFLSTNATLLTDAHALEAVQAISASLVACCGEGPTTSDRERLLFGAHLAGTALNAGVIVGHSVAYALSSRTHLPHGVSTGALLPYFLLYNKPSSGSRLQRLAEVALSNPSAGCGDLIDWIAGTIGAVGLPERLSDVDLTRDQLAEMADEVVERYPRPNNPVPLERNRLLRFLEFAFDGDLDGARTAADEPMEDHE